MKIPPEQTAPQSVPISIRIPSALLGRIDADVSNTKETRSERIIYLLQYAYEAGGLSQFVERLEAQYFKVLATTPEQIAEGAATYKQVSNLADQLSDFDDRLIAIENTIACKK